jgi:hypothetical protein
MTRISGVIVASVDAISSGIVNHCAVNILSTFKNLNMRKLLKSLKMVPRAGLEPARPLFTKLRILSPDTQITLNNCLYKRIYTFSKRLWRHRGVARSYFLNQSELIFNDNNERIRGDNGKEIYGHR